MAKKSTTKIYFNRETNGMRWEHPPYFAVLGIHVFKLCFVKDSLIIPELPQ